MLLLSSASTNFRKEVKPTSFRFPWVQLHGFHTPPILISRTSLSRFLPLIPKWSSDPKILFLKTELDLMC